MVQIGLLAHLPSCNGFGSCGIGGKGAAIVKATPIGFSIQERSDIVVTSAVRSSILTARYIGLPFHKDFPGFCSSSARIE